MQIIDGKALLLKLRNPNRVTSVIPKSKVVEANGVLVNWGIDEALTLSKLNITVPSPINSRYSWTGKYAPFDTKRKLQPSLRCTRERFVLTSRVQARLPALYGLQIS